VTTEQIKDSVERALIVTDVNAEPDWLLQNLVATANASKDSQMGVTLHVSGIIVSGTLISYEAYWLALIALVRENVSSGFKSELTALGDDLAATFANASRPGGHESSPNGDGAEGSEAPPPEFIHLRDAIVFAPGVAATLPKTLWRGRLSHVSAWSLGTFRAS
jgi:hypothetical protein